MTSPRHTSGGERALETHIRQVGLPTPEREYRFDQTRRMFDFAWPDVMIAVEVEGGTWSSGRHTRWLGYENDCIKYSEAAIAGWLLIRATTEMAEDGRAIALIERAFAARRAHGG
jgi:hypothetical protein